AVAGLAHVRALVAQRRAAGARIGSVRARTRLAGFGAVAEQAVRARRIVGHELIGRARVAGAVAAFRDIAGTCRRTADSRALGIGGAIDRRSAAVLSKVAGPRRGAADRRGRGHLIRWAVRAAAGAILDRVADLAARCGAADRAGGFERVSRTVVI